MMRTLLGSLSLTMLLASCSGGGETVAPETGVSDSETTFQFAMTEQVEFGLFVTVDGEPAVGARVQVLDALPAPGIGQTVEDVTSGNLYWNGATTADGRCDAVLKVPSVISDMDVLVVLSGATGPYTVEEYRTQWGPFGPAARINRGRQELADTTIELIRN